MARFSDFRNDYGRGNTTRSTKQHLVKMEPWNYVSLCGIGLHEPSVTDYDPPEADGGSPKICVQCAWIARNKKP